MTRKQPIAPSKPSRPLGRDKLSPRAILRAKELQREGLSTRAIATALATERLADVHHGSIARLLERVRDAGNATPGRVVHPAAPPPVPAPSAGTLEALDPDSLDLPEGTPLEVVRERLVSVRRILRSLEPKVQDGSLAATQWTPLVRCEADLAARLAALTPPDRPKDEDDPASIELGARLVRDLTDKIEESERRVGALCTRCMGEVDDSVKARAR